MVVDGSGGAGTDSGVVVVSAAAMVGARAVEWFDHLLMGPHIHLRPRRL